MELSGKAAIVTGSATGVGAASALRLARKGCNVVINYTKSEAEAEETAAACRDAGAEAIVVQGDVSDDAACRALAEAAVGKWGRIDGLVNNAGTTKFVEQSDLEGLSGEDFLRLTAVNVVGPFQMIRAVAPHMKAGGGGSVVNISSIAGVTGVGSSVAYASTKGALNTMTLSLARVMGPEIRINTICPGMIQSRWLQQGLGQERYDKLLHSQQTNLPLQRVATPDDIADAVVWFLEAGELVTGEILLVDGGQHLGYSPLKGR